MGGFFGCCGSSSGSGSGGGIGSAINYASPAGVVPLAAPAGFVTTAGTAGTGQINVDTSAGDSTWQDLTHGADGQQVLLVVSGGNNLTLNGAGFVGSVVIPSGSAGVWLLYRAAQGYIVVS